MIGKDEKIFVAVTTCKGDWTSDLGDFCNNHPSNPYAYNIYLIICKLIGWL